MIHYRHFSLIKINLMRTLKANSYESNILLTFYKCQNYKIFIYFNMKREPPHIHK